MKMKKARAAYTAKMEAQVSDTSSTPVAVYP
jgi:hypothetical protein